MRTKATVTAAVLVGMVCMVWQVERTAPLEGLRGVEGEKARSAGRASPLPSRSTSDRLPATMIRPTDSSSASQDAYTSRSEEEEELRRLYRGQAEQRLRPLATASAERVLEMLPEGFCRL